MKKSAYPAIGGDFMRGFIATGVLAAVQRRPQRPVLDQRTLRIALQGGAALAAGTAAVQAWQRRDTARALAVAVVGALGVVAAERLLSESSSKENIDG